MQEARLAVAMNDLNVAQAQLDEKNRELAEVMAMYDAAMKEKQVSSYSLHPLHPSAYIPTLPSQEGITLSLFLHKKGLPFQALATPFKPF